MTPRTMALARRCSAGIFGAACGAVACGGGAPMLHPAHVLTAGRVSAGAGTSGQFVFGAGRAVSGGDPEQRAVERAASRVAFAPGLSPWVGLRAGIAGNNEGGLTYTGRTVRADARHAFEEDDGVAISVGAGASAVLMHPGSYATTDAGPAGRVATASDLSATGFGFDVPILVGWRSAASVVQIWGGGHAGMERARGDLALGAGQGPANLVGTRWYGGGLVGFAIGLSPVWVAVELDGAYQALSVDADFPAGSGTPPHRSATLTGFTMAPAGAILGKF